MKLPTLYNLREDGHTLQEWTIEVDGNKYRTIAGMVGGKLMTSAWVYSDGKNIGRSNETSPEEQAMSEAKSRWKRHTEKGYSEDPKKAGIAGFFEPMLAHKYKEFIKKHDIEYPIYCQPKLDGVRTICNSDGILSRNGKPFPSLNFIYENLKPLFDKYPELVLDGEAYADTLSDDFDKIISLVTKKSPTPEQMDEVKKHIKYHVYDCHCGGQETFSERNRFINAELKKYPVVSIVSTYLVDSLEKLDELYGQMLEDGYEGQMIRTDTPYVNKRTNALLKRKEFNDGEFELEDVIEGKGNAAGKAYKVKIKDHGDAGLRGNAEFRIDFLKNKAKYIGKPVTIRYQGDLTKEGKFRFGVMIAVRDYD